MDVKKGHRLFSYFEELCANGNNLYNLTNFYIRQVYTALKSDKPLQPLQREVLETIYRNIDKMNEKKTIAYYKKLKKENLLGKEKQKELELFTLPTKEKAFVGYNFLDALFKTIKQKDYYSLPGQINQQVIKNVVQNWDSFFKSLNDYKENPQKYIGRPSIPRYLPKGSKKEVVLSNQICLLKGEKYLRFPKTRGKLNIGKLANVSGKFQQVRIIPKYDSFTVEVIFFIGKKVEINPKKKRILSIDLGVENIATLVSNVEMTPILFKGGKIKSINRWYNKLKSYYYAALRNGRSSKEGQRYSKRLSKLDSKRHNQIKDFFHKVSFNIVKVAKEHRIDTIIIGKNMDWKQKVALGSKNNQNFVQIPHAMLVSMIRYKANTEGIAVIETEESYTS
ncbi:RNA-guided endonuclease InsQ/TnpB family protein, partial [Bacillus niameyensis]|uniref:RNA-guided endonuclease InsQ/TnpB family protein n=1 Tax=Bacillus niameyensis TaxID=1522308 RepID=UPI0018A83BCC